MTSADISHTRYATCPSCGHSGTFSFGGEQVLPPPVAEKLGLAAPRIGLWHCEHCLSTISEDRLIDIDTVV